MFQEIPVNEKNIYAFKAIGRLTDEDYQRFLPRLEALIAESGPLSLLIELEDFHGWDLKAAWEDFKFGQAHDKDFARIAIVGDRAWQRWMTVLGKAFVSTPVRYFDRDQIAEAWDWLRGHDERDQDLPPAAEPGERAIGAPRPYQHILAAVDFSPHADQAIARAVELAGHYQARLTLLHAVEQLAYPYYDYDILISEPHEFMEEEQQLYDAARERLQRLAESLDHPDVHAEVLWGVPKATILGYAEAQSVDLIVAGSHGRHGIARLMGSTATGIVNRARCDVTVVRLP